MNVKLNTNLGMLLLGIWLILTALPAFVSLQMGPVYATVLALLAIVAGVCLVIGR